MSDDLHQFDAAYALDALDPLEARRFEAHLASCERCRSEVARLQAAAARLGEAVAEAPPADLRARVLSQIASTPQVDPAPRLGSTSWAPAGTAAGAERHRRSRLGWPVAMAAAVLAVVAAAGLLLRDTGSDPSPEDELAVVLDASDAEDAVLEGSAGGSVRVVWSPGQDATVVVASDLPPAPTGHQYELWTFTPGGPVSAGVFGPDPDGDVEARLELPADQVDGWGVTVEPADGGPGPEGPLVLRTA